MYMYTITNIIRVTQQGQITFWIMYKTQFSLSYMYIKLNWNSLVTSPSLYRERRSGTLRAISWLSDSAFPRKCTSNQIHRIWLIMWLISKLTMFVWWRTSLNQTPDVQIFLLCIALTHDRMCWHMWLLSQQNQEIVWSM